MTSSTITTNLPSRSRLGERCSPERDAIPLRTTFDLAYARCPINHLKHPRILAWARYTRLSEMTCLPRPNHIAWARYTSKIENTRPCMSRLGEPSSPERELQVLALIRAHTHCNRTQLPSQNIPIQFDHIAPSEQHSLYTLETQNPKLAQQQPLKYRIPLLFM